MEESAEKPSLAPRLNSTGLDSTTSYPAGKARDEVVFALYLRPGTEGRSLPLSLSLSLTGRLTGSSGRQDLPATVPVWDLA